MARYKGVASRATIESEYPFAVIVPIPSGGLGRRIGAIYDAAKVAGDYRIVGMLKGLDDAAAYRFKTEPAAARFRAAVDALWPGLLTPAEPPRA